MSNFWAGFEKQAGMSIKTVIKRKHGSTDHDKSKREKSKDMKYHTGRESTTEAKHRR